MIRFRTFSGAETKAAAMRLACAAAALSVTRAGAQSGMPGRAQLEAFLESRA